MAECHKCKTSIRGESGISCAGVCKKVYHCSAKCAGVDQYSMKILDEDNFVRFMCGDCVQYIHNVDLVLREIQDGVNKNKINLVEYKSEFESSLKQNEYEIKLLLEAIEKRYEERLKKIDKAQKICEKNVDEIKKICIVVNEYENKNKEIYNNIEESNEKMCKEIKKVIKETNDKQNKMSFADTVRKTVMPELKKQVPLIIKPKEKQRVEKTREDLNNRVDPINLKITNVENRSNGALVIQSENNEERDKIKTAIQNEMSENYEIKVPDNFDMSIIITDMTFKFTDEEIIDKIRKQNEFLKNSELKPIRSYEFKRNNKIIHNIKIIIDNDSYTKALSAQKINIGWQKCRVFDGTEVLMCYKCRGFNHRASDCKNQEVCYKCHGNHRAKECKEEIMEKCVNCIRSNEKLNLGLDENHRTLSKECPVYQNKLNMKMRRMGFNV